MKSFEATGRTVEEAITAGLESSGLTIGEVNVEILEEGSKGLFGLFGSRMARVRLTPREADESGETADLFKDSLSTRPAAQRQEPQPAARPQPAPRREPAPARPTDREPARASKETEENLPAKEKKPARARRPRGGRKPAGESREALPEKPVERVPVTPAPQADPALPEGVAQQFIQELTRLMGLDVSAAVSTDAEGHVFVQMDGDPQGILIGRRGETLDALQYLTSLRVNRGREDYVRVTLDSEGYRRKREEALVRLANRMANRARKTGRRVSMEPMNPYERRIFHSALQAFPDVATHSEGEEPNRHVIITPVSPEVETRGDGAE